MRSALQQQFPRTNVRQKEITMKNNSIAKATASASPVPNWVRWFLAPLVITTIALGWWFPYIGFLVPVAMLSGMIGGVFKGRFVCGNLCPRGAFF